MNLFVTDLIYNRYTILSYITMLTKLVHQLMLHCRYSKAYLVITCSSLSIIT